jgi:hypothetical protein
LYSREPPTEELDFLDDLTGFCKELSAYSSQLEVQSGDCKFVSLMLFQRLWGNHNGYITLWNSDHLLEGNIILRAAIEASICIAANAAMGEDFYPLLLGDLAATLKKMIKIWREMEASDLVKSYEAQLRSLDVRTPKKPKSFNWEELATRGGQHALYEWHRMLSATSAHVTAISVMRSVVPVDSDGENFRDQLLNIDGSKGPMQMAATLMIGAKLHVRTLLAEPFMEQAAALEARLNALSMRWKTE